MSNDPKLKLDGMVKQAYAALEKAKAYAEENDLSFTFEPEYGMGGTFRQLQDYDFKYNSSLKYDFKVGDFKWFPSSQSC